MYCYCRVHNYEADKFSTAEPRTGTGTQVPVCRVPAVLEYRYYFKIRALRAAGACPTCYAALGPNSQRILRK